MYLVGKIKRVMDDQTVAWDPVALTLTRAGAVGRCATDEHFYIKVGVGAVKPGAVSIFPRRPK